MAKYSYRLHKDISNEVKTSNTYMYGDLIKMTTYQLRDICFKEKLVKSVLNPLNREELIHCIMRYRGKIQSAFINSFEEGGIERLTGFLQKTEIRLEYEKQIQIPTKFTIYENLCVTYFDRYFVKCTDKLTESNMLLIDDEYNVYSIFNLEISPDGRQFISKNSRIPIRYLPGKQYSMLYFEQKESDFIYSVYYDQVTSFPKYIKLYSIPIIDFRIMELEEVETPLVIDFGTANTTLGIFNEQQVVNEAQVSMVKVLDKTVPDWKESAVIPSVMGIKKIEYDKVEYIFGYDALKMAKENYLDEALPIFYDIKRWINDAEREEKVITANGAYTWLKRKDLLKAFLEYIVTLARERFKCKFKNIQLLSPVRQREKFKHIFMNLLEGYYVECQLDEGVAVLFNSISTLIKKEYAKNQWYKAMVIDCGGGTTDLTSCNFKIDNNRVSYKIDLECSYENGDTNFGGNNLTFRIMQLLKVRLAEQFLGQEVEDDLLCLKSNNFRLVDKEGSSKIYESLEAAYIQADKIIPTKFKHYEESGAEEYFKVKNNYYYLFELAEQIKKYFFRNEEIFELLITSEVNPIQESKRGIIYFDKWKLSVKQSGKFMPITNKVEILFYLYEIKALLMTDIYSLMKKFLEKDFQKGDLVEYDIIKLTGQSCQSELFIEALKEFIPGRIIQSSDKQKQPNELKVCCLSGALFYFQNKKMGYMYIDHTYTTGALPYEITAFTHENKEEVLIHSLKKEEYTGNISRFMEGEQLELHLRDTNGAILRTYLYHYSSEHMAQTTFYDIQKEYHHVIVQDEVDNIINGESKFFVWVDKEQWGFYVLPVLRENEILYKGNAQFFNFEDDTWEQNFFDGLK